MNIKEKIFEAINFIQEKSDIQPQIGLTLGSGLSSLSKIVQINQEILYHEIPHFPQTTVQGHGGRLILGSIENIPVVLLQGRVHYYEGYSMQDVVFPTRVISGLGIHSLILTNASGGIDSRMEPGDFMIIRDHINLFGDHPLRGPNIENFGPRFPDMTHAYDSDYQLKMERIFKDLGICFHKGVYCGVTGPSYETPAEIQFIKKIGGHAVGMSTVPECIVANHLGLRVAGLSCITNKAAGITGLKLNHEEVQTTAQRVEDLWVQFLTRFVPQIK